ncbi:MAG: putative addiction module antidote protein [Treponema sp.]|nr:putative addiction module antidote protein [Treponema sp.]
MAKIKVKDWDTSKFLKDEEDIKYYLEAVFKDGSAEEIAEALGNIAKARQAMSKIAKKANVNNNSLYRSLSKEGSPLFKTINSAVNALGFQLSVVPVQKKRKNVSTANRTGKQTAIAHG